MIGELDGRVALVTGAGRGIGREVAARFAAEGCRVALADLDGDAAASAARDLGAAGARATGVAMDVADEGAVEAGFAAARERLGPIDTLVNVAGVWAGGSATEISIADWDRTIAVNLRGVFLCTRQALPDMVARRRGVVLNVASTAAFKGTRRAGAYNASKAAVVAFTRNVALDHAPHVRAVAICPGLVETAMERQLRQYRGDTDEYRQLALAAHPLGRLGAPRDVADAAVFLASERASWITGSCLLVDGGALT